MNVYITGTDRGLGLALVATFLNNGYEVFAGYYGIDARGLERLQTEYGPQLTMVDLDVTSNASVLAAAQAIASKASSLDLLINNAAIMGQRELTIEDPLDFDGMLAVYDVNAVGPLRVAKSVLPLLRAGEMKRIINIASEAGSMAARVRRGQRTRYAYCGSKAALHVQSILLQNHLAEYGIRLTLIEPGWIRTYLATGEKFMEATYEPEVVAERLAAFVAGPVPDYLFHDLFLNQPFDW